MAFDERRPQRPPGLTGGGMPPPPPPSVELSSLESLDATKQRVFNLLSAVTTINNLTGQVGTPNDTVALRRRIMREADAATTLITQIDSGLRRARVNVIASPGGVATSQRELDRLAEHYAGVKTRIVDAVRASQQRQRQFRPIGAPPSAASAANVGAPGGEAAGGGVGSGTAISVGGLQLRLQAHTDVDEAIAQVGACVLVSQPRHCEWRIHNRVYGVQGTPRRTH